MNQPPLVRLEQTKTYNTLAVRLDGSSVGLLDVTMLPILAAGVSAMKGTLIAVDGTYLVGTMEQLLGAHG
jgi:hypothetical protein